jgi:hypothetical protein
VSIGSVNASMYALVADGHNGLRIVQMISPDTVKGSSGFSPRPAPRLIASFPTPHPTLAVTRGLDRDRVTDETGQQTVVFGRRGSRPFHLDEMRPFLKHANGDWYKVENVSMKDGKLFTASGVELKDPYPPKPVVPALLPGAPAPEGGLQPLRLDLPPAPLPGADAPMIPPTKILKVTPEPTAPPPAPLEEPKPAEPSTPIPPSRTLKVPPQPRAPGQPATPPPGTPTPIPPTRILKFEAEPATPPATPPKK